MKEQEVALGDRLPDRIPGRDVGRGLRRPGRRPRRRERRDARELDQKLEVERSRDAIDGPGIELEEGRQLLRDFPARRGFDLKPHRIAAPALLQDVLHRVEEILRLLIVGREVRVARHSKESRLLDLMAREQLGKMMANDVLEENEMEAASASHLDPSRVLPRKLDQREALR